MANGFYGYTIGDILFRWSEFGVFAYLLPFLMIFAIVFGILNKTDLLGDNKGVQATIALAVGLLSLQFDYVANFYATIFPYAGMGIAVLLIALILMGLITDDDKWPAVRWIWFGIGFIIFLIVLLTSMTDFAWYGGMGYGWADSWPAIVALTIILILMGMIIWGGGGGSGGK